MALGKDLMNSFQWCDVPTVGDFNMLWETEKMGLWSLVRSTFPHVKWSMKCDGGRTHSVEAPWHTELRLHPKIWVESLKWLRTLVHIFGDGFVRWTSVYKHIPEVHSKAIFQRWRAAMLKSQLCLGFADWKFTSPTLGSGNARADTCLFHCLHHCLPLLFVSIRDSGNLALLCGCTWLIWFHS